MSDWQKNIIYESGEFESVVNIAKRVAPTVATVLIQGESGTGKELIARLLHSSSFRAKCPFTAVNCAALPEALLESELFGYDKGAFTGADHDRKGLIEETHQGTLFIDEIGDLPANTQVKLLRFLQDHSFYRVGGRQEINVDVRIVTATHRNLAEMVREGSFREDLFYRLNVVVIKIPPLRFRRRDIRPLTDFFVRTINTRNEKSIRGLTPAAWQRILRYDWPGNVRELENAIEHAVILATKNLIDEEDLPPQFSGSVEKTVILPVSASEIKNNDENQVLFNQPSETVNTTLSVNAPDRIEPDRAEIDESERKSQSNPDPFEPSKNLFELVEEYERKLIEQALVDSNGNRSEAARRLGISEKNIRDRLQKWNKRQD